MARTGGGSDRLSGIGGPPSGVLGSNSLQTPSEIDEIKLTFVEIKLTLDEIKLTFDEIKSTLDDIKLTLVEIKSTLDDIKPTLVKI